jgi:Family of unknown function (DUF6114)
VTTADTATARPSAWQRFRMWRRGRPFWGGLVAMIAGIEIYGTSQQSIGDMEIKIGPGGMASYVIPLMLVAAGLLAWFTPAQRHFYGIVVPAVSIYALLEINFGGWLIGTVLGMVGGALIFAWTEDKSAAVAVDEGDAEPDGGEYADGDHSPRHAAMDELMDGPDRPAIPRPGTPGDDRATAPTHEQEPGGHGRMLAIATVPLLLVVAGIVAMNGAPAAYATPCPVATATTKAAVKPARPSASAPQVPQAPQAPEEQPAASSSPAQQTGPLAQVVGGIVHLLDASPSPSETTPASPEPSTSPTPGASHSPAAPKPSSTRSTTKPAPRKSTAKPCPSASPVPPAKRLAAAAGQPDVAANPSRLTGSTVTMTNLVFQGIVDLPTADGPIKVLKFTMDQAVTEDFELLTYARGNHIRDVVFKTKTLTIKQNVAFYTSRFQGKALGVFPVDYSPENTTTPIPLTLIPNPIFFTDPDIQLVWVDAGVLTATPSLTSTLA